MFDETLLSLAADIISAHVSNNSVPAEQLPQLIESAYNSLASLGQVEIQTEEPRTPAVSIRSSVKPDSIVCLECGSKFKTIRRHIASDHDLSVEEYRLRWNLPIDYPLVSSEYAERRRELAKSIGLGRKGGRKKKADQAKATPVGVAVAAAAAMGEPTSELTTKAKLPSKVKSRPRKKSGKPAE
ncbi:MucR family transcriptional regulator (plasmid) [Novosphingobium sp. BL-8A]|uniref:MucR family transcriptional regulator n=1 Tax=Novosphingobium sp. BL-8A TaxID=3127639 RepID=UPI0037580CB7